ncbi:MAG: undecaprenyl-phosphate glucose phosphotransferase [Cyclobacteriaceae bacterium]
MDFKKRLFSPTSYFLFDLIIINLALCAALFFRFDLNQYLFKKEYQFVFALANLTWILSVTYTKPHRYIISVHFLRNTGRYVWTFFLHFLSLTFLIFLADLDDISRAFLIYYLTAGLTLICLLQLIFNKIISKYKHNGFGLKQVLIIGEGEITADITELISNNPEYSLEVKKIIANSSEGINIVELENYLRSADIDQIYCCIPHVSTSEVKEVIRISDELLISVHILTDYRGFSHKKLRLERYGDIPVLSICSTPLDEKRNTLLKRIYDIFFSTAVILLVLSWLHPVIAILIKISSKGPVLFKQQRHGKNNDIFGCYKFRSMVVNKEADSKQATKKDSRITKIGAFLRKSSIDELPQIYNVFLGDMSIVGPRPHPIKLNEQFENEIEKLYTRHYVKPGITGLAQAKGYRGGTEQHYKMQGRVKLDRFYVENWTLILDLKIIYLTILSLFKKDNNAY